jgi:AIPR protein
MTNDPVGATVRLSYLKIRDVSTKDEEANGASTYVALLPAAEILKVGTDGNLRSYIPAHEGKKRNLVHKAIARTIRENCDRFSQLNSGFLIGASKITVDDNKKIVTLRHASVNNGAQSQGEIQLYFDECNKLGVPPVEFAVRCELSIEPDAATRTSIAVARNTATKIEGISIAGKFGYFEDLAVSFKKTHPNLELARSETDVEDKFVDTRLLLQVLWAMMPEELAPEHRRSMEARMRAYKNAAYCLQDFMEIFDIAHRAVGHKPITDQTSRHNERLYSYFVDMAGPAWAEYLRWHAHEGWNDKRLREPLRQVVRGEEGVVRVSDGIIFPILSALSKFVRYDSLRRHWKIVYPKVFQDEDMLIAARRQLIQCDGRPMLMGRSGAAYEALMILTEMAERYSAQIAS